ncbi:hypothetical protein LCER1_G008167, partial [Lachnellula cervina]
GGQARAAQFEEPAAGNGNPGNFANRPTEESEEAAAGNGNLGNFANRLTEEVRRIASKGGSAQGVGILWEGGL